VFSFFDSIPKFSVVGIFLTLVFKFIGRKKYELICKMMGNKSYPDEMLEVEFGVEMSLWIRSIP
jgi:hypothetical protein